MSEQNPPPGQPTPPPGEPGAPSESVETTAPITPSAGVGPTASEGDALPPPPPGETTGFGDAPPPPPPARKSRAPWIIGVAALLVVVLVAGGAFAIVKLTGEDTHSIATPSSAGGMKRDTAKEAELKQQLDAAEKQFQTQAKNVSYVKSGVYNQANKDKGPEGALVFLGAKLKGVQSPTKFVESFGKQAGTNGFKIDKISAGDGGGKAVCASQATGQKIAICAWATKDSMGELIPTVPGWDSAKLASIMRSLRADVEKSE
jgi:hypothetical protein